MSELLVGDHVRRVSTGQIAKIMRFLPFGNDLIEVEPITPNEDHPKRVWWVVSDVEKYNVTDMSANSSDDSAYPDGNPKTAVGMTKPPLRAIPPVAILHLGKAMADGERKYTRFNWRDKAVTTSVYYDAMLRHALAFWDGEDFAEDSGCHHLGHVMACCAIILDAAENGMLIDDRRRESTAAKYIAANINR